MIRVIALAAAFAFQSETHFGGEIPFRISGRIEAADKSVYRFEISQSSESEFLIRERTGRGFIPNGGSFSELLFLVWGGECSQPLCPDKLVVKVTLYRDEASCKSWEVDLSAIRDPSHFVLDAGTLQCG